MGAAAPGPGRSRWPTTTWRAPPGCSGTPRSERRWRPDPRQPAFLARTSSSRWSPRSSWPRSWRASSPRPDRRGCPSPFPQAAGWGTMRRWRMTVRRSSWSSCRSTRGTTTKGSRPPIGAGRGKGWLAGRRRAWPDSSPSAALIGRADVPEHDERCCCPAPPPWWSAPRPRSRRPTRSPVPTATASWSPGRAGRGTIRVDEALGDVTSVAGGRGMVVAVLSNGEARRWLDGDDGERQPRAGRARAGQRPRRHPGLAGGLTTTAGRRCAPSWRRPNEGSRAIPVPEGWRIAGVNGQGLVLVGSESGVGVAVWEPWEIDAARGARPRRSLPRQQRAAGGVAARRGAGGVGQPVPRGADGAHARRHRRGGRTRPTGVRLALVGRASGGRDPGAASSRPTAPSTTGSWCSASSISTFGWTAEGDFLANPGGGVEYRYDPSWGLTISDRRRLG